MKNLNPKILCVVGTRSDLIKIASFLRELKKDKWAETILVFTGQHYDYEMSQIFFQNLDISKPKYNLKVGSGSHAFQTGKIIERLEPILIKEKPNLVIVVGDVNSTLAGALTATKLHIPIVHIESGLRSFDMLMPEEINRKLTDHISNFLFATEPSGVKNLLREGISKNKIFLVGNTAIDILKDLLPKIRKSKILKELKLKDKDYGVLTLHRPENVDNPELFKQLLDILTNVQEKIKIIFPIHPRTKKILEKLEGYNLSNVEIIKPLGYLDFLALVLHSKFVLTDSGGIQEETTFLKIPCLTLRKNTERPITITLGSNILCDSNKKKILNEVDKILKGKYKKSKIPKFWDGKTTERIIKILKKYVKHN